MKKKKNKPCLRLHNKKKDNFNKKTPKKTLKQILQGVYYGTVNLDTECKRSLTCCETAMPQMNYCEFIQLIDDVWADSTKEEQMKMIMTSIEYFFRNQFEKWGMESLVKPCMLLKEGKCGYYDSRPLSCRMYGLWPSEVYEKRVDKFEKAYEGLLTREELPLNKQCPNVKRKDESVELTEDVINSLYEQLDQLDGKMGNYSDLQIEQKENYRTFHDWLLLKIFGEEWLVTLTQFLMGANKELMVEQIDEIKKVIVEKFSKEMPNLKIK